VVNVMAAYQPVVQACSVPHACTQADMPPWHWPHH